VIKFLAGNFLGKEIRSKSSGRQQQQDNTKFKKCRNMNGDYVLVLSNSGHWPVAGSRE
jgi:hypothetical protein